MKNEKKLKKINASDNAYYTTWAVLRRPNLDETKVTFEFICFFFKRGARK